MARKKVKLAFIENNSQRKATFNKRKKGLIKKVTELTTLCDVKACAIIYSPYDEAPEVWPSDEEARRLALEFKALPEIEQQRKNVDQEAYLRQRLTKNDDQMKKLKKESKDLRMDEVLSQSFKGNMMMNMNISDLNDFGYKIDQYFKNVMRNIEIRHESGLEIGQSSNAVAAASEGIASTTVMASTIAPMAPIHEVGGWSSSSAAFYRPTQQQPQFQYPPLAPHAGQFQNLNMSLNHNKNQRPWYMEMMNHNLSNADDNQPQPHQPTTGDSTNSTAAPSPNNDVPATNPNPTNNI